MKIKHIVLATAAASALLASSSVFAIGASQGGYLAGQLGAAWNNLPSFPGLSENPFAWGVNGGYNYQIENSNFLVGGQIGIEGLGNTKLLGGTLSYYSLNVLGTATYLLPENFYVWGETGPGFGWTTASVDGFSNSKSKFAWVLGAGLGYHYQKWNFYVRYDHIFGQSKDDFGNGNTLFPAINAVFGGVAYTF